MSPLKYDVTVSRLTRQCRAAIPEIDWVAVSKLEMLLKGWWDKEFPMFRILAWVHRADGTESGRMIELAVEFVDYNEKGAIDMALEAGRRLLRFTREE